MKHHKITKEGQPCRKCCAPLQRRVHPPGWAAKPGKTWFSWWFWCPRCRTAYMVPESARVEPHRNDQTLFDLVGEPQQAPQADRDDAGEWAERFYAQHRHEFADGNPPHPIKHLA